MIQRERIKNNVSFFGSRFFCQILQLINHLYPSKILYSCGILSLKAYQGHALISRQSFTCYAKDSLKTAADAPAKNLTKEEYAAVFEGFKRVAEEMQSSEMKKEKDAVNVEEL